MFELELAVCATCDDRRDVGGRPACVYVRRCCSSDEASPEVFNQMLAAGWKCIHPAGDKWATVRPQKPAVRELPKRSERLDEMNARLAAGLPP